MGTVEVKVAEDTHAVEEAVVIDKTAVAVGIDGLRIKERVMVAEAHATAITTQFPKLYADGCV